MKVEIAATGHLPSSVAKSASSFSMMPTMISCIGLAARKSWVLPCGLVLVALVACEKESPGPTSSRIAATASSASSRAQPAPSRAQSDAREQAAPPLAPLPDALPPTLGADWNAVRAAQVAASAMERSTAWPALGLCTSACRVDARMLMEGEEPGSNGTRHLVVLSINASESDGAGDLFQGTAVGVCSFERREGLWTLADCRPDAARLPNGYGQFDGPDAVIRSEANAGVSIVVEWSKWATGEEARHLVLVHRVDGRFVDVLELDIGEDTHGNYADRPDVETSWKATWDFQKNPASMPDIIATAIGNRGVRSVDCRARFHFDGRRYAKVETSAGRSTCPWADEVTSKSAASAG